MRTKLTTAVIGVTTAAVLAAAGGVASAASAPQTSADLLVLDGQNADRYVPNGAVTPLGRASDAASSADGTMIIVRDNHTTYTMRSDGTHKHTVPTNITGNDYTWSPDHTRVAFEEGFQAGGKLHLAIRVMNVTTGASHRIAVDKAYQPRWSPDGKWLAVTLVKPNATYVQQTGIGLLSIDGKTTRVLTTSPTDRGPAWSPDGHEIAYDNGGYSATHPGHVALVARNVSTNAVRIVATLPRNGSGPGVPYWSPDGKQIAIDVAIPHGDTDTRLTLIKADGSGARWAAPAQTVGAPVGWLAR